MQKFYQKNYLNIWVHKAIQAKKNYLNYSWFHHILNLKITGESEEKFIIITNQSKTRYKFNKVKCYMLSIKHDRSIKSFCR